jgi:hypothetical protein
VFQFISIDTYSDDLVHCFPCAGGKSAKLLEVIKAVLPDDRRFPQKWQYLKAKLPRHVMAH